MTSDDRRLDTLAAIGAARTVIVMRLTDHTNAIQIATALVEEGLCVMEVTLDHSDSLATIAAIARELGPNVVLGAGTVRTIEQVHRAAAAGAVFCVSPNIDAGVVAAMQEECLVAIPGAFTPTEIALAVDSGADLVKIFPAGAVGPDYLRALTGPFRGVKFVPTGGISHTSLQVWYEAGAVAIGLGSDLLVVDDLVEMRRRASVVLAQSHGVQF